MRWSTLATLAGFMVVGATPAIRCSDGPSGVNYSGLLTATSGGGWRVEVSPEEAEAAVGDTVRFEARVYNPGGNLTSQSAAWKAEGEAGSVDAAGLFTAKEPGSALVIASAKGAADTAQVTVQEVIVPDSLTTVEAAVIATDADSITVHVSWDLDAEVVVRICCREGGGSWPTSPYPEWQRVIGTEATFRVPRLNEDATMLAAVIQEETGESPAPDDPDWVYSGPFPVPARVPPYAQDSLRVLPKAFAYRFWVDSATQDTTWEKARWSPLGEGDSWTDTAWVSGRSWPIEAVSFEAGIPYVCGGDGWYEVEINLDRTGVCLVPSGLFRPDACEVTWTVEVLSGTDPVTLTPREGLPAECSAPVGGSISWLSGAAKERLP